jgi:hypothetical protein
MKKCAACGNLVATNFAKCPICNADLTIHPTAEITGSPARRRNGSLFIYGIAFIGGGAFANAMLPKSANQGEQLGAGIVVIATWVIGLILLIVSAVKAIRSRGARKSN